MWEGNTSPDGSMWEGMRTDGNSHDGHPAEEEPHPEIGGFACLLLSLLGTAVSGPPVGASPDADRKALLIVSQEVLRREHAHAVRLCFAKYKTLVPELTERQVDALALAPPSFLTPHSGISIPLWLPRLVTVRTAAPDEATAFAPAAAPAAAAPAATAAAPAAAPVPAPAAGAPTAPAAARARAGGRRRGLEHVDDVAAASGTPPRSSELAVMRDALALLLPP